MPKGCVFAYDDKNCLSPLKITACVVVSLCVILFSYGKKKDEARNELLDEELSGVAAGPRAEKERQYARVPE